MLAAQNMLRMAFGNSEGFTNIEADAVSRLVAGHAQLLMDDGQLDMKSDEGYSAATRFLQELETAAQALKLEAAPRKYRSKFTVNYRAIFPDENRNYRVDILEASAEQYAVIYVNGDKFEFSADTMRQADELQGAFGELRSVFGRWATSKKQGAPKPTKNDLQQAMDAVDIAWASFEDKYISELIGIEYKARQLIVDAYTYEERLQQLEKSHHKDETEITKTVTQLVGSISKLNATANSRRKGRDDLRADILFGAQEALRRCDMIEKKGISMETVAAARILASDVVESFDAMRKYLREVKKCLERVDPHLCNNQGLVTRLVDWEESWEVGAKYVQQESLLQAICDIVTEVRSAQKLAPALVDMCNDCDVELFLVLPRIIWLRFLSDPSKQAEFLKTLLPHRFSAGTNGVMWDSGLADFISKFHSVLGIFNQGDAESSQGWTALVKRAVSGESSDDTYRGVPQAIRTVGQPVVDDLMRDLEGFSIELQRHCAEDWNQCSAVLIQCLSNSDAEENASPFHV
jgi:hypothetical protein